MRTWLTDNLGLTVPVVCAPMAGVVGGELASAVSVAGGLGMLGAGAKTSAEWIRQQGEVVAASARPFGIGLQAWVLQKNPDQFDAALELNPVLMSISYGPCAQYVDRLRQAGILMATTVGTLAEARAAADAGVDVIVARGGEGGGHGRNDVGTLPLLQAILDAVDVPVLAAGGVGSSRGLAAVIAAGAAGAWAGTAFLTCIEGENSARARARLISATDTDTVHGRVFDVAAQAGWPAEFGGRALRTTFFDEWVGRESDLAGDAEAVHRYAVAGGTDDDEIRCVYAGQGVALLRSELTAADVVGEFARAEQHLRRALGSPVTSGDSDSDSDRDGDRDPGR